MRILFVLANPTSTDPLELSEELRQFQRTLTGHDVKLSLLPAAQREDLKIAIASKKVDIVHFTGHGEEGRIIMHSDVGVEEQIPPEELNAIIAGQGVKVVVLNACETSPSADKLKDSVDTVIGTSEEVDIRVGAYFSKIFYAAIARGASVKEAYDEFTKSINKHAPDKNVFMGHGLDNQEVLLSGDPEDDRDIELEGRDTFDNYFYVKYLDEQIADVETRVRKDRFWAQVVFGGSVFASVLLVFVLKDHIAWLFSFLPDLFSGTQKQKIAKLTLWKSFTGKPLLESIIALGALLPPLISSVKYRFYYNGQEELRSMRQLKELVKSSSELSPQLRHKLHKIMDQNLLGQQLAESNNKEEQ